MIETQGGLENELDAEIQKQLQQPINENNVEEVA